MKLPTKVKVAGFDIKIEEFNPASAQANARYGEFSPLVCMFAPITLWTLLSMK